MARSKINVYARTTGYLMRRVTVCTELSAHSSDPITDGKRQPMAFINHDAQVTFVIVNCLGQVSIFHYVV